MSNSVIIYIIILLFCYNIIFILCYQGHEDGGAMIEHQGGYVQPQQQYDDGGAPYRGGRGYGGRRRYGYRGRRGGGYRGGRGRRREHSEGGHDGQHHSDENAPEVTGGQDEHSA